MLDGGRRTGSFRGLIVWQRVMDLAATARACSRRFPRDEVYGLTAQVRRAAVSVPSNIAEGQARETPAEFRHFLRIALVVGLADEVCRLIRRLSDSLGS